MQQFVTIENQGTTEFRAKYDGATYVIPPGESRIVPYQAMCVWMGDPSVTNKDTYKERDLVYRRICRYFHARGLMGNEPEKLPKIAAFDQDGNRIITVMDDPEGKHLAAGADDAPVDIRVLQQQIERLQAQLETRLVGLTDTPQKRTQRKAVDDSTPKGGRGTVGTAGRRAKRKAAEDAIEKGEVDPETGQPFDETSAAAGTPPDLPVDEPTKVPVGKP